MILLLIPVLLAATPAQDECLQGKADSCMKASLELLPSKKYSEALDLLERGCTLQNQVCCSMGATLLTGPFGFPPDPQRAAHFAERSGALLDKSALYDDWSRKHDRELQERVAKEHAKYERAERRCRAGGTALDCLLAGDLYVFGNPEKAYELLVMGAKAHPSRWQPFSGVGVADVLARQGKVAEGNAYLERACNEGFGRACHVIAECYGSARRSLPYDKKKTLAYEDKACIEGDGLGCLGAEALGKDLDPPGQGEREKRLAAVKQREAADKAEEAKVKAELVPWVKRIQKAKAESEAQQKERVANDRLPPQRFRELDPPLPPAAVDNASDWAMERAIRRETMRALAEDLAKELHE